MTRTQRERLTTYLCDRPVAPRGEISCRWEIYTCSTLAASVLLLYVTWTL